MDVFFGIFVICALFGNVLGEEQQCSRYHYEAQTLERIIKAEFTIAELKNKIDVYQSKITDDHSKLEQRVELIQKAMNKVIENITEIKVEKQTVEVSSMRQYCTSDDMCSDVENAECKRLTCKCKPGLSYHHATRKCLSDCGDFRYGSTYQVEVKTYLSGFNLNSIKTVTIEECVNNCTVSKEIICRTAEYYTAGQVCNLSFETLHTNPEAIGSSCSHDVFTRDCN
ncbi:uncharacterized protein LOC132758303 isoform X1 [Ruditapes philippinarum]|uniref:uncharacterized protein LOC132758303 isoform X1 n=1 Tax=Ruditapes philippinarum TaxID=129788 RepID=UPI00295AF78A|nr:uncharacterized protein LOC132758303 isoform X1 [Ruditapes philippinarum]